MLSPPDDLVPDQLTAALSRHWGVVVADAAYRPVGFGSHHWAVTDPGGSRWFLTVDDLDTKRRSMADSRNQACARLQRALATARALHDGGATFVLAPEPTAGGAEVARIGERYAAGLYRYVDGESFDFGEYAGEDHRRAVLDMVIRVHSAPEPVRRLAPVDDLDVPGRDAVHAALDGARVAPAGPFADKAARLVAANETGVRDLLARFDALVAGADRRRAVLTHGEPHPGNTLRTADGWRLIDWDTAAVAPPERDLWMLGDASPAYTDATGVDVLPEMLQLFRLRWRITDLAIEIARFRRPHSGGPDDELAWEILQSVVGGI